MIDTHSAPASWLQAAMSPAVVKRSRKVSLIVGTILVAINQGDLLLGAFHGAVVAPELLWKVPLTYCVPYAVSTYAAVDAMNNPPSNTQEKKS